MYFPPLVSLLSTCRPRRPAGRTLHIAILCCIAFAGIIGGHAVADKEKPNQRAAGDGHAVVAGRPNVLMIAIDDQNDWIGCLDGHPLIKTPNIDRLAARGTLMANAHCQSPLCNPSRTSLMLGLRPTTTGIYGLSPWFRNLLEWRDRVSLPQYFAEHGYRTYCTGKIYHGFPKRSKPEEFQVWGPPPGVKARPPHKLVSPTPMGNHPLVDWGVFPHRDEEKNDYRLATWTIDQIRNRPEDQPFFLAVGFFLPHVPCYTTQHWYDMYPGDDSILPVIREDDRADTPRFSWYLHWRLPEPRLKWLREVNQWQNLTRSYMACTSFIDAQVGRVLDALDAAGIADETIVVLWSDHGWHLGEKGISGKNTLWERSTHVPLIFAGPGVMASARCDQPAELLDIYPTLIDLCGLPDRDDLEGHSLVPQLKDPATPRPWPAITSHNQGNHGIRTRRWRYIRYADGSEELYDIKADPREWDNLAGDPEYGEVLESHRRWLPKPDRPLAPGSGGRVLTYDPETGVAVWEGKRIDPDAKIPGT